MPEEFLDDFPREAEWLAGAKPLLQSAVQITASDWVQIAGAGALGGPLAGALVLAEKCWENASPSVAMAFLADFTAVVKNVIEIWNLVVNDVQPGFQGEKADQLISCLCRVATACGNPPDGTIVPDQALVNFLKIISQRLANQLKDQNGVPQVDQNGNPVFTASIGDVYDHLKRLTDAHHFKYDENDQHTYTATETLVKLLIDGWIRHNGASA